MSDFVLEIEELVLQLIERLLLQFRVELCLRPLGVPPVVFELNVAVEFPDGSFCLVLESSEVIGVNLPLEDLLEL